MTLAYRLRVRDLIHGFVYLTELESRVIDHPLFQRLRWTRQNDITSLVYPSLNTTRFDHSLGTAWVAGRMAENILLGANWPVYKADIGLDEDEFVQTCRLYALLHDLGHLPLSHLFEAAFEDHAVRQLIEFEELVRQWTGVEGYSKLHEAVGALLAPRLIGDVGVPEPIAQAVTSLMTAKQLDHGDPLRIVKLLVDSEIDADRTDSTARDGRLAGGEYGTYDIERLAASVFVIKHQDAWRLAYSHKAVGTLESLLFDRYRTHVWIHHHHRVIAIRTAARHLIAQLIDNGAITPSIFGGDARSIADFDESWLWRLLRTTSSDSLAAERDLVLYRDKSRCSLLWKWRREWTELQERIKDGAARRTLEAKDFARGYETFVSSRLPGRFRIFFIHFVPVEPDVVALTDETGSDYRGDLMEHSTLVATLPSLWAKEPQYYATVFSDTTPPSTAELRDAWVDASIAWLRLTSRDQNVWTRAAAMETDPSARG